MAMDRLAEVGEATLLPPAQMLANPEPDLDAVKSAAKLLGTAKKPLIVVGGGALGASEEVLRVAQMLQAPVVSTRLGRGVVSDANYLSQSAPVGHRLWASADVVLAVGTRLQHHRQVWGEDGDLKWSESTSTPRR